MEIEGNKGLPNSGRAEEVVLVSIKKSINLPVTERVG